MRRLLVALPVVFAIGAEGCKKTPEPPDSRESSGQSQIAAPKTSKADVVPVAPSALPFHVTWADPPGWPREAKQNPMRKATFHVPRAAGDPEDGELAVFYFGSDQGGGIEANVQRWVAQFDERKPEEPKRADRQANGLHQHTVEIEEGNYTAMMPGTTQRSKPKFAMIAAIVEAPSGSYFFKLIGPKKTVAKSRDEFYRFMDTVKAN